MNTIGEFTVVLVLAFAAALISYPIALQLTRASTLPRVALSRKTAHALFCGLGAAYVLVLGYLSLLRHETLHSGWDLSITDQVIWNSLHGRLFENTIMWDSPSLLGHHFSPLVLALVPLYAVWADVRTLLIVQPAFLAIAALPIYFHARAQLGNLLALLLALSFFLFPALLYVNLYDFHEIVLVVPLLTLALFFLSRQLYAPFLVCLALALLVKEEVSITVAAFGVFVFVAKRKYWLGSVITIVGVMAFFLLLLYIIPFFYGGGYYFVNRYPSLGQSVPEIIRTVLTQPDKVWMLLSAPRKVEFVLHLLVPLALMPLLGAEVASLSAPAFGYLLLSDDGVQASIRSQYSAVLIPFLFFAAIDGLRRLLTVRAPDSADRMARQSALAASLLVVTLASYYLHAPGPLSRNFSNDPSPIAQRPEESVFSMDARARTGRALIARVPRQAVVVTTNDSMAQFSDRRYVYEFPTISDYRRAEYLFAEKDRFWYTLHQALWANWLATGFFELVAADDIFLLARRRMPERDLQVRFGDHLILIGSAIPYSDTLRGGSVLRPVTLWRADKKISGRYGFTTQLTDARGHIWAEDECEPHNGVSPTDQWEVGRTIGDQYTLRLPPTMPAGEYDVTVAAHTLQSQQGYLPAFDALGNHLGDSIVLATVRIEKNKASFTASQLSIEQPLFVDMREMRFLGYVPPREKISPGELLPVGVYWRARAKPQGDYVVVVQLRDATGRVAFEQASRPANGTYPTTEWDAGEVLLDWHDFTLPRDLAIGDYAIYVLLRDASHNALGEVRVQTISVVK